ncbi:hypothetical protein SSCH_2380003 [Syntrophaceticus schinkii]|uniref:RNA polymerase sigma-70 region 3 domain-containing protein n=1 Tax=Syntrophaceticus schinkii TaxID=499207 RepID=A0A0B7ML43_9FIRM|nr:hypothetical protein SSCH_2380003 [Syntrophaceticus schinkii]
MSPCFPLTSWERKRHLRREVSFDRPGWVADLQSHIYRTIEELSQKNGEPPTLDQIAEEVNIRKEGVAQALQAGHVSLDDLMYAGMMRFLVSFNPRTRTGCDIIAFSPVSFS